MIGWIENSYLTQKGIENIISMYTTDFSSNYKDDQLSYDVRLINGFGQPIIPFTMYIFENANVISIESKCILEVKEYDESSAMRIINEFNSDSLHGHLILKGIINPSECVCGISHIIYKLNLQFDDNYSNYRFPGLASFIEYYTVMIPNFMREYQSKLDKYGGYYEDPEVGDEELPYN